jgi:hypothetical protein
MSGGQGFEEFPKPLQMVVTGLKLPGRSGFSAEKEEQGLLTSTLLFFLTRRRKE